MYELGFFLKEERKKRGLSLEKVADSIEVSSSYLFRLEKGTRRNPSVEIINRLAQYYSLDISTLFEIINKQPDSINKKKLGENDFSKLIFFIETMNVDNLNDINFLLDEIKKIKVRKLA